MTGFAQARVRRDASIRADQSAKREIIASWTFICSGCQMGLKMFESCASGRPFETELEARPRGREHLLRTGRGQLGGSQSRPGRGLYSMKAVERLRQEFGVRDRGRTWLDSSGFRAWWRRREARANCKRRNAGEARRTSGRVPGAGAE